MSCTISVHQHSLLSLRHLHTMMWSHHQKQKSICLNTAWTLSLSTNSTSKGKMSQHKHALLMYRLKVSTSDRSSKTVIFYLLSLSADKGLFGSTHLKRDQSKSLAKTSVKMAGRTSVARAQHNDERISLSFPFIQFIGYYDRKETLNKLKCVR